jgi:hypothetical protein
MRTCENPASTSLAAGTLAWSRFYKTISAEIYGEKTNMVNVKFVIMTLHTMIIVHITKMNSSDVFGLIYVVQTYIRKLIQKVFGRNGVL